MSELKKSFEIARDKNNIGLILPEFLSAKFSIVGVNDDTNEGSFSYALTKSPSNTEMCITVSENPKLVSFEKWSNVRLKGRQLLETVPENAGILIVYETGGDYITRRQINWFLEILD
ncbi:MAG: hypothetical protein ACMZ64_09570 [Oleiphilus sp.]